MKTTQSELSFERKTCRSCSSTKLHTILDLGNQPLANSLTIANKKVEEYPLVVIQCERCSLVQLKHTIDPKKLFSGYLYRSAINQKFIDHFNNFAASIRDLIGEDSFVLDVGCNDGILLEALKRQGVFSIGVDYSDFRKDWLAKGVVGYTDDFTDLHFSQRIIRDFGYPQAITACNVFAHVADIHGFIRNMDALLAPNGYFIVEVVDLKKMVASGSFDMIYHEHLFYYDIATLKNLLGLHGFSLYASEKIDTHGGSIRAVFKKSSRNSNLILKSQTSLRPFLKKIETDKKKMRTTLTQLQNENIIGFGAPAKATVLAHYYEIDRRHITSVIDDNADKQGKYIPNTGIKIVPFSKKLVSSADYIFIFAWNFADSIKERCHNGGFKGKFIIPFIS